MENFLPGLKWGAALGSGVIAGVFFAFSTFIMRALARLPAPQGIAAMQSINITVINPLFMAVFLGTALLCLVLGIQCVLRWGQPGSAALLAGALTYLLGTIVVTVAFNVPLNDALAKVDPSGAEGTALWSRYQSAWSLWNHVRGLAALGAAALFTLALLARK